MILTSYRAKISRLSSYLIGAEAISEALNDVPDVSRLSLKFWDSPVWPASAFAAIFANGPAFTQL